MQEYGMKKINKPDIVDDMLLFHYLLVTIDKVNEVVNWINEKEKRANEKNNK